MKSEYAKLIDGIETVLRGLHKETKHIEDVLWDGGIPEESLRQYVIHKLYDEQNLDDIADLNVMIRFARPSEGWGAGFCDVFVDVSTPDDYYLGKPRTFSCMVVVRESYMFNLVSPGEPWFQNGM